MAHGLWAAVLLLAGCGGAPAGQATPGVLPKDLGPTPPPAAPIGAVFILESGGTAPEDTVVVVPAKRGRVIMVRRGAPDNSLFARIVIPADSSRVDSIRVTVRPRPGQYGVDLDADRPLPLGVTVIISYAVHFVAPAGARDQFGSDLSFERALFVGRATPDGLVTFLPTARPGSDLVAAAIPGPGRYLVSAPKGPR